MIERDEHFSPIRLCAMNKFVADFGEAAPPVPDSNRWYEYLFKRVQPSVNSLHRDVIASRLIRSECRWPTLRFQPY